MGCALRDRNEKEGIDGYLLDWDAMVRASRWGGGPRWCLGAEGHIRGVGEDLLDGLDFKGALPVLQLNLALHPQSPMACVNVAEALFRLGRRAEAVPVYAKAKSLFAADPTAMSDRTLTYYQWRVFRLKALETAAK